MTMPSWNQDAFAAQLRASTPQLPLGLSAWNDVEPQRRFAVYRNNVRGALAEALAVRYPVVQRLVGEDFFRAMAQAYALANLPASPVLIAYGADFPNFIASFEPAGSLPYLADVARLESCYWQAYHAADEQPLDPNVFATLAPQELPQLRFKFIEASAVVCSNHPVVSIWQTNAHDMEVSPVDLAAAEDGLVSRPGLSVEVRKLPEGAAAFILALKSGKPLEQAATEAQDATPAFDLARNIGGLIEARIIRSFT